MPSPKARAADLSHGLAAAVAPVDHLRLRFDRATAELHSIVDAAAKAGRNEILAMVRSFGAKCAALPDLDTSPEPGIPIADLELDDRADD